MKLGKIIPKVNFKKHNHASVIMNYLYFLNLRYKKNLINKAVIRNLKKAVFRSLKRYLLLTQDISRLILLLLMLLLICILSHSLARRQCRVRFDSLPEVRVLAPLWINSRAIVRLLAPHASCRSVQVLRLDATEGNWFPRQLGDWFSAEGNHVAMTQGGVASGVVVTDVWLICHCSAKTKRYNVKLCLSLKTVNYTKPCSQNQLIPKMLTGY